MRFSGQTVGGNAVALGNGAGVALPVGQAAGDAIGAALTALDLGGEEVKAEPTHALGIEGLQVLGQEVVVGDIDASHPEDAQRLEDLQRERHGLVGGGGGEGLVEQDQGAGVDAVKNGADLGALVFQPPTGLLVGGVAGEFHIQAVHGTEGQALSGHHHADLRHDLGRCPLI